MVVLWRNTWVTNEYEYTKMMADGEKKLEYGFSIHLSFGFGQRYSNSVGIST